MEASFRPLIIKEIDISLWSNCQNITLNTFLKKKTPWRIYFSTWLFISSLDYGVENLSYPVDIKVKFTATLNFTRKTDMVRIVISDECDICLLSEIWRGTHSSGSGFFLNRIAKAIKSQGETKRFAFLWAAPVYKHWKLFQSQVSRSSE